MSRLGNEASPDVLKSPSDTDSAGEPAFTPPDSEDRFPSTHFPGPAKRQASPSPLRLSSLPENIKEQFNPGRQRLRFDLDLNYDGAELASDEEMSYGRPSLHRPTDGHSQEPLLKDDKLNNGRGRTSNESAHESTRPPFAARRSTFRSRSPSYSNLQPPNQTRRKYIISSFFLLLSLISFVVQTETAAYIQRDLGWNKAYCMMWLTHGSWSFLWPTQLLIIRLQKRKLSWPAFWRRHKQLLRTTAQMVQSQKLHLDSASASVSPIPYMVRTTAFVTTFLTIAGASWYVAVDMTSSSDLTAIYNCSAFFAYVFSILLLNDKLRFDKAFSVTIAIVGVLVIAYGDKKDDKGRSNEADNQLLGNLIIGVGSVLYGLYEVLYKKLACPPEGTSPGRGMIFANTVGSMIGAFTLTVLWIPLPILHYTGLETFVLPRGKTAGLLAISTLSNAVFSGSFLVLMSLTSPVLSSVAALMTIFLIPIVHWNLTGDPVGPATIIGGIIIIVAFFILSWATYREMDEERKRRESEEGVAVDDEDD